MQLSATRRGIFCDARVRLDSLPLQVRFFAAVCCHDGFRSVQLGVNAAAGDPKIADPGRLFFQLNVTLKVALLLRVMSD